MNFQDLFYHYFVEPIQIGYGYNIVNTIVYAILFVSFVYFTFIILKRLKIKIDQRLVLAIIPLVLLGSSVRVLEDAKILSGYFFVTPGIWFLFFLISISILLVSLIIQKKTETPYYKAMFVLGVIPIGFVLGMLDYKNISAIGYIFVWFIPWLILINIIKWTFENKTITLIHIFDAVTTSVSIKYFSYFEQHVVPRNIINLTGSVFSFVLVKIIVVISVLLILDKYSDDEEFKNFIKIVIGILGFVPGTRDFLRLVNLV